LGVGTGPNPAQGPRKPQGTPAPGHGRGPGTARRPLPAATPPLPGSGHRGMLPFGPIVAQSHHPAKKTSSEDSRGPNGRDWLESSPYGPKPPTVMTAHSRNHPRWKCRTYSHSQLPVARIGARPGSGGTAHAAPPPEDGISERKGADNGCLQTPTHRARVQLRAEIKHRGQGSPKQRP